MRFRSFAGWQLRTRATVLAGPQLAGPAGRFVVTTTLATASLLVIALAADWRNEVIAPGPLAANHAQLLRREGTPPDCAACHAAGASGVVGWAASVVGHGDAPSQSQLCMKCHERTIRPEFAVFAHNVDQRVLASIRQRDKETRRQEDVTQVVSLSPPSPVSLSISCAACHREHHGAEFNLTAMDNAACQACHQKKYDSFSGDHPDFSGWPYLRQTPIAFNHASHNGKHFPEEKQAFDCRKCHVEDRTGAVQLLTGYEAACAACHDRNIANSVVRGVPMLAMPTLDVAVLDKAGFAVSDWPERATGDFDGRLPPAMKLLLAGDPSAAKALAVLGDDFEFFDVDPKSAVQLAACAVLAKSITKLLRELNASAATTVRTRLSSALGRELTETEANELVAGLSLDTLRPAINGWLGSSGSEPPARAVTVTGGSLIARPQSPAEPPAGAWFRDEATLSIRYRPAGHADPILTRWLTLAVSAPDVPAKSIAASVLKELSQPTAAGLCASCHSIERTATGRLTINWHGANSPIPVATDHPRSGLTRLAARPFTKFSHSPHTLLPDLANCTECHQVATDANIAHASWNPHEFVSDFLPMEKQQCATCHTRHAAGDRCQTCHNYHAEALEFLR